MFLKQLVLLAVGISAAIAVDHYQTLDDTYDGSDASPEELAGLVDCLSDTGPCTPLGAGYRQHYPEVVIHACARCSPVQKRAMCGFMKNLSEVVPERFKVFVDKYDPKGIYFDKFLDSIKGC